MSIRPIADADWDAVWTVLEPVFRAGETYAYPIDITKDQARAVWVDQPAATFVAEDAGLGIVGTYILKPNQPGRGAHVCNCGYVVSEAARGQGVASAMCDRQELPVQSTRIWGQDIIQGVVELLGNNRRFNQKDT